MVVGSRRSRSGRAIREPVTTTSCSSSLAETAAFGFSCACALMPKQTKQGATSNARRTGCRGVLRLVMSCHPSSVLFFQSCLVIDESSAKHFDISLSVLKTTVKICRERISFRPLLERCGNRRCCRLVNSNQRDSWTAESSSRPQERCRWVRPPRIHAPARPLGSIQPSNRSRRCSGRCCRVPSPPKP